MRDGGQLGIIKIPKIRTFKKLLCENVTLNVTLNKFDIILTFLFSKDFIRLKKIIRNSKF